MELGVVGPNRVITQALSVLGRFRTYITSLDDVSATGGIYHAAISNIPNQPLEWASYFKIPGTDFMVAYSAYEGGRIKMRCSSSAPWKEL